ncbi:MAG TPA: non-homologous end-joining DNA ligase [Tepidisphaeraceae bacterium]|nr:non-homologous end-joining DNA ligase [Tepidisphaeraceae bacterium]
MGSAGTVSTKARKDPSPLGSGANAGVIRFGSTTVKLSNLNKVLYPTAGFTKGDMIAYYLGMADFILPHLKGRKLTRKRYPDGVDKLFFFEKNCPSYHPEWVATSRVDSAKRENGLHYCVVENKATLAWLANLAAIEFHTLLSKGEDVTRPTYMVFDLDPGAPATMLDCIRIGFRLKEMMSGFGVECLAKTSGGKGLHIYVPLNTPVTFDQTKSFAHAVARVLEKDDPKSVVSAMKKNLRDGKVFVDWSQNDEHKTTCCVYSLRARERPTVSTPVTWDELANAAKKKNADALIFEAPNVLKRVEKLGDLFAPVLKMKQKLPAL